LATVRPIEGVDISPGKGLTSSPNANSEASRTKQMRFLTDDEYATWDQLVQSSSQGSAFCRSWWVRAVGGTVLGCFEAGRLIAGIPLYFESQMGVKICTLPKLTQTWGVILESSPGKPVNAASRETEVLRAFADYLAKEKVFYQCFHPSFSNWLPFYWKGFRQTSRYTYVLENLSDLDEIWNGMAKHVRNTIRKAESQGLVVEQCTPGEVFDLIQKTFRRQKLGVSYGREYLSQIFEAASSNGSGECLAVLDRDRRIHAATLNIWDDKRAYYLAAGGDPDLRASGAQVLLMWHSIKLAASRSKVFDFEGSMKESVERVFRSFGAKQTPYHCISKLPFWLHVYLLATRKL
jgi:hypothetical protein